jgi:hypothetical protein
MKKIVLAALACALAGVSIPQRAYACESSNCAVESTVTQMPTATVQPGKTQTACNANDCARPEDEEKNKAVACETNGCARPEEEKNKAVACSDSNCAHPENEHERAAASMTPAAAAVKAAAEAIKKRVKHPTGCSASDC